MAEAMEIEFLAQGNNSSTGQKVSTWHQTWYLSLLHKPAIVVIPLKSSVS